MEIKGAKMIRVLEKNVSDKIAAGEVIDRPVSIVKELVENSIDAGARNITVEIRKGGRESIRVTDDGSGIDRVDAETAFLRHATSKIRDVSDLDMITSLGFRGEALASIAAVTRTTLITKTSKSSTGCRLVIHGGKVLENTASGCPDGTSMIVDDLFYNTPARREFLKSDAAESGRIIEFMQEISLAYTDIRFQLINNGKIVFTGIGNGSMKSTVLSVYKQKEYRNLIELDHRETGFIINGLISLPSLTRSTRKNQIFFVNGRVVKSRVLEKAVSDGYKERVFPGRFPVVFLDIRLDPASIDVNIHPSKREIRFHDEKKISNVIINAIVRTLGKDEAVIDAGASFEAAIDKEKKMPENSASRDDLKTGKTAGAPEKNRKEAGNNDPEMQLDVKQLLQERRAEADAQRKSGAVSFVHEETPSFDAAKEKPNKSLRESNDRTRDSVRLNPDGLAGKPDADHLPFDIQDKGNRPFEFSDLLITGSIFRTYITATDKKHFYLIDQHAAHERIFYEKLVAQYLAERKLSQPILTPFIVDVPLSVKETEISWIGALEEMGYKISEFGPNTYRVTEIPTFMEISEAESFLRDFLEHTEGEKTPENRVVIDKLIRNSCKNAVKANDVLSMEEMIALIEQLSRCRNPFSCPHGRPTFVRMSVRDIEKLFKRVQ